MFITLIILDGYLVFVHRNCGHTVIYSTNPIIEQLRGSTEFFTSMVDAAVSILIGTSFVLVLTCYSGAEALGWFQASKLVDDETLSLITWEKCGGTDGAHPGYRSEIPEAAVETEQLPWWLGRCLWHSDWTFSNGPEQGGPQGTKPSAEHAKPLSHRLNCQRIY